MQQAQDEQVRVLREGELSTDINDRMQTATWLTWSIRNRENLATELHQLETKRQQILAEYYGWKKRVRGWETLIEKARLALAEMDRQQEQEMADEFATRKTSGTEIETGQALGPVN